MVTLRSIINKLCDRCYFLTATAFRRATWIPVYAALFYVHTLIPVCDNKVCTNGTVDIKRIIIDLSLAIFISFVRKKLKMR